MGRCGKASFSCRTRLKLTDTPEVRVQPGEEHATPYIIMRLPHRHESCINKMHNIISRVQLQSASYQ